MFAPLNIPIRYNGTRLDVDSYTDSNEYEWGLEPLSEASTKEVNEQSIDEEQVVVLSKIQTELENMWLKRPRAYEKAKKGLEQVTYGNSIEELEASQASPTINLEEVEWERREKLVKLTKPCEQVCQLQGGVEGEQERTCTCNIKDVYIDSIHTFEGQA